MMNSVTENRRWLCRPARPTAVVLFAAAAVLAVFSAVALADVFTAPLPLPPAQYGTFGGPHALAVPLMLTAGFIAFGARLARGLSPRALAMTLLMMIAAGPVGWGLAFLDSLGPEVINAVGAAGAFLAILLLVVAPLVTVLGLVAGVAELFRAAFERTC